MSKVRSIFGSPGRSKFGCGSLSQRDIDDLLSGELDELRSERFEEHCRVCDECVRLSVAVERFRTLVDEGVLESEARRFALGERSIKARLREEFERAIVDSGQRGGSLPWGREMSADELEQIAAAGPDGPTDPVIPKDDDEP